MRTVKTKKELIKAIQDGEKHIKIKSLDLYAACKLAEAFDSVSALFKHFAITSIAEFAASVGINKFTCTGGEVVTITISILISAVAIIGILKDKIVKIKCKTTKEGGVVGEIEIG